MASTTLPLQPGLNILIGPNGAGKTSLMAAVVFLRDMFRFGAARAVAAQGGPRVVYNLSADRVHFSIEGSYGTRTIRNRKRAARFQWSIDIMPAGAEGIATIAEERITVRESQYPGRTVFDLHLVRRNADLTITPTANSSVFGRDLFDRWGSDHRLRKHDIRLHIGALKKELQEILSRDPDYSFFPLLCNDDSYLRALYDYVVGADSYDIHPEIARQATNQLSSARMQQDGFGVAEVIDALERKAYGKIAKTNTSSLLRESLATDDPYLLQSRYYRFSNLLIERHARKTDYSRALVNITAELAAAAYPITGVGVKPDDRTGKRYVYFTTDAGATLYPEHVSDGTMKWLCILVSLFIPFALIYIIEEPENFLHPWMQQRLLDLIRSQSNSSTPRIFLLSSHSATLLNAARPAEVLIVQNDGEGTQVESLTSRSDITAALEKSDFHVGDLWVGGLIGGVPGDE